MFLCYDLETQNTILGEVHVTFLIDITSEDIVDAQKYERTEQSSAARASSVHRLALEVTGKRALAVRVVLQCFVTISRKGTRQNADVATNTLLKNTLVD